MNDELTLCELQHAPTMTAHLQERGLSEMSAAQRVAQFAEAAAALQQQGARCDEPVVAFFVPGRIEVLGKHTDYAGGRSLVCTVDRGFAIVAAPTQDQTITLTDAASGESTSFTLSADSPPKPGHWSNYAITVARRLARNFDLPWRGANIAFTSDLPAASGLSSSSAMIVAVFHVLSAINRLSSQPRFWLAIPDQPSLADYLGAIESGRNYPDLPGDGGVGTFGGSEDHTAILCSEAGVLKCFAYAPTRFERQVPMPEGWIFALGFCGVRAEKTGAAQHQYNDLSQLAAQVAAVWREHYHCDEPTLAAIVAREDYSFEKLQAAVRRLKQPELEESLLRRMRAFEIEDQQVIPAALAALESADFAAFGAAVAQSQQVTEELLRNQIDATKQLVRLACDAGAAAASAFGAGFGGSVWALVPRAEAEAFCTAWSERYRKAFPKYARTAEFFLSSPASPVTRVS